MHRAGSPALVREGVDQQEGAGVLPGPPGQGSTLSPRDALGLHAGLRSAVDLTQDLAVHDGRQEVKGSQAQGGAGTQRPSVCHCIA